MTESDHRARLAEFLAAHARALQRQGIVQAFHRPGPRGRYGPYFRIVFREDGRQRTFYLGGSDDVVGLARAELDRLQRDRKEELESRRRLATARRTVRAMRQEIHQMLARRGLRLQGWELRGVRAARRAGRKGEST